MMARDHDDVLNIFGDDNGAGSGDGGAPAAGPQHPAWMPISAGGPAAADPGDPAGEQPLRPRGPERRRARKPAEGEAQPTAATAARKRRRTLIVLALVIVVVGVGGFIVTQQVQGFLTGRSGSGTTAEVTDYPGPGVGEVNVTVNAGDGGDAIATSLRDAGVIATRGAFLSAANADPRSTTIQPGTYVMKQEMRAVDALAILLDSSNRIDFVITIPEGYKLDEVTTKIQTVMGVTADDVAAAVADTAALGLPEEAGGNLEGWIGPGQYVLPIDGTPTQALQQMVARQVATLDSLGVAEQDRQTVLIKASMIQAEVRSSEYYSKVARVIENRIEQGMPLQLDAVVAYGAGKPSLQLTAEDFANADNPFNVYVHTGLPPAPISNPSEEVIAATLAPEDGDWIYYITVNLNTGETRFTADYQEFLVWRAEYFQWKEENGISG